MLDSGSDGMSFMGCDGENELDLGEPGEMWQISEDIYTETVKVGGEGSSLTVNSIEPDSRRRGRDSGRSSSR